MDLEVKRAKTNLSPWHCFHLALCLPQWKVESDSDYPLVTPPAGGPVCQPGWEVGTLSWCGCSAGTCLALSPSPSPLITLKPS